MLFRHEFSVQKKSNQQYMLGFQCLKYVNVFNYFFKLLLLLLDD